MSDFQLQGEIQIDQSGLTQFENAAVSSGEKAGKSLNEGLQKGSKNAGKQLQEELQKGAAEAKKTGKKVGDGIAEGTAEGAKKIPKVVGDELKKAEGKGKAAGKTLGDEVGKGVEEGTKKAIPDAVKKAMTAAKAQAKGSGKQLSLDFSTGFKQGLLLDDYIVEVFDKTKDQANAEGKESGDQFVKGVQGGVAGKDAGTDDLFKKTQAKAKPEGDATGRKFGEGVKGGVEANRALFKTVVEQAKKAAKDADLIFDSTTLEFRYPNGGIIPERELARIRKLDQAVDEAAGAVEKLGPAAKGTSAPVKTMGDAAKTAGTNFGLLDGVIAGLTATLSGALLSAVGNVTRSINNMVQAYADLDYQVRLANSATGEGESGYNNLKKAIDTVGVEAAASQEEIALLATELTRAGLSSEEAAAVMPSVARAAEGTGTAFAEMASIVGSSMNNFGMSVEEAGRVTDILVATANQSSTSVVGLGNAMKYAGPAAASLGVSMEDTAASVGLLANAGIDAEQAGTGLRTMLTRLSLAAQGASGEALGLTRGQEKLATAMKILGAEVTNTDGTLKPMDQTLKALKQSMNELSAGEQIELATALFGEQGATKFLALVNQSEEDITNMFGAIRNSKGATAEARKNVEGLKTTLLELGGSIDVLKSAFAKVIGAAITPFVKAISAVVNVFNNLPGPIKDLIAALTLMTAAWATAKTVQIAYNQALKNVAFNSAITEVAKLGNAIKKGLVTDIRNAKATWLKFVRSLNKASLAAAIAALKKVGVAIQSLKFKEAGAAALEMGNALVRAFKGKGKGVTQLALDLGDLGTAAKKGGPAVEQLSLALDTGAKSANAMGKGAPAAGKGLTKLGAAAGKAKLAAAGLGKGAASAALAFPPLTIAAAALGTTLLSYNGIMGQAKEVTKALQPPIDKAAAAAKKAGVEFEDLGKQGDPLGNAMKNAGESVKGFGEKLGEIPVVGKAAQLGWKGFTKALEYSPFGLAIKGVTGLTSKLKEMYKTASDNQAFIEGAEQLEQFDQVTNALATDAIKLTKELEELKKTGTAEEFDKTAEKGKKLLGAFTQNVAVAKQLETKFKQLAAAARENGDEEQAQRWEALAASAGATVKQLEAVRGKMVEVASQSEAGAAAMEAYAGKVDAGTQALIELQEAAASVDLNLKGAELSLQALQAGAALESQRFDTAKAHYSYQLQQLQGVKGAEAQREEIKKRIDAIEKAQHAAAKRALEEQIILEGKILALNQKQAQLKANLEVQKAQITLKERELELTDAQNEGDQATIDIAKSKYELQASIVGIYQEQKASLGSLQGLERDIFNTQSKTKRETLATQAAAKGWSSATSGVATGINQASTATSKLKNTWTAYDGQVYQNVQRVRTLADGTKEIYRVALKLPPEMQKAATASQQMGGFIKTADGQMVRIGNSSKTLSSELTSAAAGAKGVGDQSESIGSIGTVNPQALSVELEKAATSADALGNSANAAAQDLNNIPSMAEPSTNMGSMASSASEIANSNMATTMKDMDSACGGIAASMGTAATNASNFYTAMKNAAGIPCNKWMGGDVKAGTRYTVNEMGQEAFRSRSGRLSLINKPAWGQWRAPSDGVVIPAGMTARLKDQGAFDRSPGRSSGGSERSQKDELPGVIGKLQKSVDELVAKDWNVQVRVRNSEGSSALSVLNKMRT